MRNGGGIAFFHLNDDDFQNQCGLGSYPLLRSALSVFCQSRNDNDVNHVHQKQPITFDNVSQTYLTSFLDVVQKYGNIERTIEDEEEQNLEVPMPCTHSGYMRHPEDCTRFYRCLKMQKNDPQVHKLQYTCAPGLVFDEKFQICNWPSWSPSCLGSGEITSTTRAKFVCQRSGFFQDPENCEYFHYCSNLGKVTLQPYEFKCPFELGFDQEKLQCNWKWLVKGCQYVPPEERVTKDLHQILPQDLIGEEKIDRIEPAASEISAMLQTMFDSQPSLSDQIDEFEERSDDDHHQSQIEQLHQIPPIETLTELNQNQASNSKIKEIFSSKLAEIYKKNPSYLTRLQSLSSYVTSWMTKLRQSIWPKSFSTSSSIQSRADGQNYNNGNSKTKWLMKPFNRIHLPKFHHHKSFKKPKNIGKDKRQKSSLDNQQIDPLSLSSSTRTKKIYRFDKNTFKVSKLNKFSKRKRTLEPKQFYSKNSMINFMSETLKNPNFQLNAQIVPMFVADESVSIPQFISPAQTFSAISNRPSLLMHNHNQNNQYRMNHFISYPSSGSSDSSGPSGMMMVAETSNQPISILPSSKNQFNNGISNKMNRYKEPSSSSTSTQSTLNNFRLSNTFSNFGSSFGLPSNRYHHHSPTSLEQSKSNSLQEQFKFLTTKSPSFNLKQTNNPKSGNRPQSQSSSPSKEMNTFNLEAKPSSQVLSISEPKSTGTSFQHSYGLPSVNIRYSYLNDKPKAPVRPTVASKDLPVKIEATKLNFPEKNINQDDVNSADLQLENFLRNKFISSLNIDNKLLKPPSPLVVQRPKMVMATTLRTTARPTTTSRLPSPITSQTSSPSLPKINSVNQRPVIPQILHLSTVAEAPITPRPSIQINPSIHQQNSNPKSINKFTNFVSSTDLFANERNKFFKDIQPPPSLFNGPKNQDNKNLDENRTPSHHTPNRTTTVQVVPNQVPKVPAVNYKLTPITDNVFEINNKNPKTSVHHLSSSRDKNPKSSQSSNQLRPQLQTNNNIRNHEPTSLSSPPPSVPVLPPNAAFNYPNVQKQPPVQGLFDNYDQHIANIHNNDRFELIRSTPKPEVKFESYEWTTPSSLKDQKMQINFDLMSAKEIEEEINRKKHIFNQDQQSFNQPLPFNQHNFFPPIGNIFEDYAQDHVHNHLIHNIKSTSSPSSTTKTTTTTRFVPKFTSTTPAPITSLWTKAIGGNSLLNDSANEYIMLLMNKEDQEPFIDHQLAELLQHSKNLGKIYNVGNDRAAQTILALLPNKPNKPFVYKGENSLLQNISSLDLFGHSLLSNNDQILKLDISKPDSQILQSIFDKVKDEMQSESFHNDGSVSQHQGRRVPSNNDRNHHNQYHHQTRSKMQNLNRPYQSTASTSTRALPVRTTTTSTTTTTARPTIQNYTESQPYWNIHDLPPHHSFEYEPNLHQSKPNRITNVWYEDVPKITDDFADVHYYEHYPSEEPTTTTRVSSTRSTTISSTTPSPSTTISTTVTQSTTVATTPSQTTTLASTTSALDEYDMASKSQRKAQPRRRPDYGQRNRPQRPQKNRDDRFDQYNHKIEIKAEADRDTSRLQQQLKTHSLADYHNQNHFGQKLKGDRQRGGQYDGKEDKSYDKTSFYDELPEISELNYPETQNNHHPSSTIASSKPSTTTTIITTTTTTTTTTASPSTTSKPTSERAEYPVSKPENTYYPESTIHNLMPDKAGIPELACTRPGIFQHPNDCNKYYECYWDKRINKFTLHPFECPVKLAFDSRIIGCASPNDPTVCVQY